MPSNYKPPEIIVMLSLAFQLILNQCSGLKQISPRVELKLKMLLKIKNINCLFKWMNLNSVSICNAHLHLKSSMFSLK